MVQPAAGTELKAGKRQNAQETGKSTGVALGTLGRRTSKLLESAQGIWGLKVPDPGVGGQGFRSSELTSKPGRHHGPSVIPALDRQRQGTQGTSWLDSVFSKPYV